MFEQRNIKRLFLKTKKQTKDFLLSFVFLFHCGRLLVASDAEQRL